jgi:hypothetical protein
MNRKEHLSSNEIKYALEDHDEVLCQFETFNQSEGEFYIGYVHLALPNHKFLVSDATTQVSYVVSYRNIKYIEYTEREL